MKDWWEKSRWDLFPTTSRWIRLIFFIPGLLLGQGGFPPVAPPASEEAILTWSPEFSLPDQTYSYGDFHFPWDEAERMAWYRWLIHDPREDTDSPPFARTIEIWQEIATFPREQNLPESLIQSLRETLRERVDQETAHPWEKRLQEILEEHRDIRETIARASSAQMDLLQRRSQQASATAQEEFDRRHASLARALAETLQKGNTRTGQLIETWNRFFEEAHHGRRWYLVTGGQRLMNHLYGQTELKQTSSSARFENLAQEAWQILAIADEKLAMLIRAMEQGDAPTALFLAQEIFFLERVDRETLPSRIPSAYREQLRRWQQKMDLLQQAWEEKHYERYVEILETHFPHLADTPPWKQRTERVLALIRERDQQFSRLRNLHREGEFTAGLNLMAELVEKFPAAPHWPEALEEWLFQVQQNLAGDQRESALVEWRERLQNQNHALESLWQKHPQRRATFQRITAEVQDNREASHRVDDAVIAELTATLHQGRLWEAGQLIARMGTAAEEDPRWNNLTDSFARRIRELTEQNLPPAR